MVSAGTIHRERSGPVVTCTWIREPENAGPIWVAIVRLPYKSKSGDIIPSRVMVKPQIDEFMSASRLAEVADWLTALYQTAEKMDADYPSGYLGEPSNDLGQRDDGNGKRKTKTVAK